VAQRKYDEEEYAAPTIFLRTRSNHSENYLTDVHGRKPFIIYLTTGLDVEYLRNLLFLEMYGVHIKVGNNFQKYKNEWELPDWSQIASEFGPHFDGGATRSNLYEYVQHDPTSETITEYWQGATTSWDSRPRCNSYRTNQAPCAEDVPNGQVSPSGFGGLIKSIVSNIHPMNKDRIVTIFAWNEWAEGAALEESVEFGSGFLKQLL